MKQLIIVICLVLSTGIAHAQTEISYDIKTVDTIGLMDIDDSGDLIADDPGINHGASLLLKKRKGSHPIDISCPGSAVGETFPIRVSERQEVAGYCHQPGIGEVGFIRHKDSSYTLVSFPGSSFTAFYAINGRGAACGFYFKNGIYHGFCWDKGIFTTIDLPIANSNTVILGLNNKGKKAGAYFTVNPVTGEDSEWSAFLLDNENFTPLVYPNNGSWTYPLKLTNDDLILGLFDNVEGGFQGGSAEPAGGVFVRDDNHFFKVTLPATMNGLPAVFDVNGMNDHGEIVGEYRTFDCVDIMNCKVVRKGFIATPR